MEGEPHGEDPLQGKRHFPSPLIVSLVVAVGGGGDNDSSDRPTHLQSSRTGTSKGERNNLGSVGGGVRNEQTPRDTFQRLSDRKDGEVIGLSGCGQAISSIMGPGYSSCTHKERNENRGVHQNEAQDGGPAVAETVGDGSGQEDTDKSTTLTSLEEGTLPSRWDDPIYANRYTERPLKSLKCDEVTAQKHVERLHDLVGIKLAVALHKGTSKEHHS